MVRKDLPWKQQQSSTDLAVASFFYAPYRLPVNIIHNRLWYVTLTRR